MKEIREVVYEILTQSEEARGNDNYLIYKVFQIMGWSTDLKDIANSRKNRFETIRRYRQKIQETNPQLQADEFVMKRRDAYESIKREEMRGL